MQGYSALHMGCGNIKLEGFLNVDIRRTSATDVVLDCADLSALAPGRFELIFSNAFFEHVYMNQRGHCLNAVHNLLSPGGAAVFTGLPNFEEIARSYLQRKPGVTKAIFDLSEVYRYTHGLPEEAKGWWLEQLHKGLFDTLTVTRLLSEAGFVDPTVFGYCWGKEPVPVNMGFLAFRGPDCAQVEAYGLGRLLQQLPANVNISTLRILT